MGKDKARPALSLVGYEDELRPAMVYVFGSTLICDTLESAKKVVTVCLSQVMVSYLLLEANVCIYVSLNQLINPRRAAPWVILVGRCVCLC